ncbi:hypothetical protein TPE_1683 [Treponema pedis str. T A4]|uniref:Uncharacterized protein n=1 Tax=Treponema pedis str. T A4 TaxID=1291379 RepID=S5ZV85_9SPIR|nr:hypothetical protein TPE_1683 [Treponema pedis str. T A4]
MIIFSRPFFLQYLIYCLTLYPFSFYKYLHNIIYDIILLIKAV